MEGLFITGPNRSGKDTFVKNYEKKLDSSTNIIRSFPPNKPYLQNEYKYLDFLFTFCKYNKELNTPYVAIRNHIDCYVYGKIYRNYDILDNILEFEDKLINADLNITSVILLPNIQDLINREDGKSLFNMNIDNLQKELDLYNEYASLSKLNTILININNENTDEVFNIYLKKKI